MTDQIEISTSGEISAVSNEPKITVDKKLLDNSFSRMKYKINTKNFSVMSPPSLQPIGNSNVKIFTGNLNLKKNQVFSGKVLTLHNGKVVSVINNCIAPRNLIEQKNINYHKSTITIRNNSALDKVNQIKTVTTLLNNSTQNSEPRKITMVPISPSRNINIKSVKVVETVPKVNFLPILKKIEKPTNVLTKDVNSTKFERVLSSYPKILPKKTRKIISVPIVQSEVGNEANLDGILLGLLKNTVENTRGNTIINNKQDEIITIIDEEEPLSENNSVNSNTCQSETKGIKSPPECGVENSEEINFVDQEVSTCDTDSVQSDSPVTEQPDSQVTKQPKSLLLINQRKDTRLEYNDEYEKFVSIQEGKQIQAPIEDNLSASGVTKENLLNGTKENQSDKMEEEALNENLMENLNLNIRVVQNSPANEIPAPKKTALNKKVNSNPKRVIYNSVILQTPAGDKTIFVNATDNINMILHHLYKAASRKQEGLFADAETQTILTKGKELCSNCLKPKFSSQSERAGSLNNQQTNYISNESNSVKKTFNMYNSPNYCGNFKKTPQMSPDMLKIHLYKEWLNCLAPDSSGNMPIHNAVSNHDITALKRQCMLLKTKNSSVNIKSSESEMTPLHMAVINNCNTDIIKILLENGADPGMHDLNGNTCYHLAVIHNAGNIVELLLQNSTNLLRLDSQNFEGYTALMLCALYDNLEIAELLLAYGADPNKKDAKSGRTVLFHAIEKNDAGLVKSLLGYGANIRAKNYAGMSAYEAAHELDVDMEIRSQLLCRADIVPHRVVNKRKKPESEKVIHLGVEKDGVKTLKLRKLVE